MRLIDTFRRADATETAAERAVVVAQTWETQDTSLAANFESWARDGYGGNAIVFAVLNARLNLFTEARFKFRRLEDKGLFGTPALSILEQPWTNGSTGDLLARAEQDAFIGGEFFVRKTPDGMLERLRPDRVDVCTVVDDMTGAVDLFGYVYRRDGFAEEFYAPHEIVHWTPIPDPLRLFRGLSVLTSAVRDVNNDVAMTTHKSEFFTNAATPNLLIQYKQKLSREGFETLRDRFQARFGGPSGDKTLILDDGAEAMPVGVNFEQMMLTAVQAAGEARIAAAASVPPQVVGLQVGIEAGGYANYREAFKAFGSGFMRSHWRSFCAAMAKVVEVPAGSELWFDTSDIAALQEAETERAEATATRATAINSFITAGFDPASVVAAVTADDLTLLKHTGAVSVQLYPAGKAPTNE